MPLAWKIEAIMHDSNFSNSFRVVPDRTSFGIFFRYFWFFSFWWSSIFLETKNQKSKTKKRTCKIVYHLIYQFFLKCKKWYCGMVTCILLWCDNMMYRFLLKLVWMELLTLLVYSALSGRGQWNGVYHLYLHLNLQLNQFWCCIEEFYRISRCVNDHKQNSQLSVSTSKEMLFRKSNATAEIAKRSINLMALGR